MPGHRAYVVIVVGSGAGEGIEAAVLAKKGVNVLCLEAGRMLHPGKNFYTHRFAYEWPHRGQGKPGRYGKLPRGMEWKIKEWTDHLYTIPEEDPYAVAPAQHSRGRACAPWAAARTLGVGAVIVLARLTSRRRACRR